MCDAGVERWEGNAGAVLKFLCVPHSFLWEQCQVLLSQAVWIYCVPSLFFQGNGFTRCSSPLRDSCRLAGVPSAADLIRR